MEQAMEIGRSEEPGNEQSGSAPPPDELVGFEALDWERFYQNYRKPGYVTGYEIGHKLGGGVFGVVYKARKESIGKAYAIKFLKVDDPSVKSQVLRELEQVSLFAQVDHPNLVSIEDKGVIDGIPFIVMGYAGEDTLKDRLEDGALSEEEALRVFVQICRGVQALHDRSLIHFDLKPANVFLKGDIARVGDYGLSKLISTSRMSLSFGRGTPYYMAPEMLERRGDHRSDIYSLGVILFECLSGQVPFQGDSEWEVLRGHENEPVRYPDSIAPQYQRLLAGMLEKDPDQRIQSLDEVLQMLRAPGRMGESIVLEYGASAKGGRSRATAPRADRAEPSVPVEARSDPNAHADAPRRQRGPSAESLLAEAEVEAFAPTGIFGSLIRALVIALLLPVRVLGIGVGRALSMFWRVPMALLAFLGQATLFMLGALLIFVLFWMFFSAAPSGF
jgi:serine/threonine protein kinase